MAKHTQWMARQGDILLIQVPTVPKGAVMA